MQHRNALLSTLSALAHKLSSRLSPPKAGEQLLVQQQEQRDIGLQVPALSSGWWQHQEQPLEQEHAGGWFSGTHDAITAAATTAAAVVGVGADDDAAAAAADTTEDVEQSDGSRAGITSKRQRLSGPGEPSLQQQQQQQQKGNCRQTAGAAAAGSGGDMALGSTMQESFAWVWGPAVLQALQDSYIYHTDNPTYDVGMLEEAVAQLFGFSVKTT